MSQHLRASPSQVKLFSSPGRTMQEVTEQSRDQAAKKLLEKRIQELEYKLKQQEMVNQRLQSQLQETATETQQIGRQFQDALNDLKHLRAQGDKKDQQIGMLLEENEKVVQVLERLKNDQEAVNSDHVKTIQNLERQVRDRYGTEKKMNDEIERKTFQVRVVQQQYQNQIKQLQSQVQEQEETINDLKERLLNSEKQWSTDASLGILAKKRGKQIEILSHQNNEQQLQIQDLQNKIQLLLEENKNLQHVIETDNSRVEDMKQLIKNTEEKHREQLERQKEINEQQFFKLREQHRVEIQNKLDQLDAIKEDLKQKVNRNMKESTLPIVDDLKSARNQINNLQEEVSQLKLSKYKSLQHEAEDIQSQFEQLLKKNNQLSEQNFLLQQKMKRDEVSSQKRVAELESQIQKLQQIQQVNEGTIDELQLKSKELPKYREKSLENIKFHVDSTKQTCELETKIKKLQDKIEQLNIELKEKNTKIISLQDQVKQAQYEKDNALQTMKLECTQELRQMQDKMKQELSNQSKMFNEAQKPFQDQLKQASIEQQRSKQHIIRYQQEVKQLEQKFVELMSENQRLQQQLEKQKHYEDHLLQEKQRLENRICDNTREIESWKEKYVKTVSDVERGKEKVEREIQRSEGLRLEINRLQDQVKQLATTNNELEVRLEQTSQESRVLKNQLVDGLRKEGNHVSRSSGGSIRQK